MLFEQAYPSSMKKGEQGRFRTLFVFAAVCVLVAPFVLTCFERLQFTSTFSEEINKTCQASCSRHHPFPLMDLNHSPLGGGQFSLPACVRKEECSCLIQFDLLFIS